MPTTKPKWDGGKEGIMNHSGVSGRTAPPLTAAGKGMHGLRVKGAWVGALTVFITMPDTQHILLSFDFETISNLQKS